MTQKCGFAATPANSIRPTPSLTRLTVLSIDQRAFSAQTGLVDQNQALVDWTCSFRPDFSI
ncbi:hypothetical protein [Spirosoma foliorum]|uniref:Uncharacterized protein n=1 Tax=Spirosoma foliorum TaxID=2710596 RepID=A0A7G5GX22_9BACT|nr:hypothetical protein [Spirosoma foliorum]QMW03381.1 hypothetical protein H3H32_36970 [Spirosoma foliorum]QMW03414.1 hypothetical protein H3H32_00130 [Spirosoma foliorum]